MKSKSSNLIILVGQPASAKSRVGREIVNLRPDAVLIDLDAVICEREHSTISEIFAKYGEEGFREIERRLLNETLSDKFYDANSDDKLTVISLGGGTIANEYTGSNCLQLINEARIKGALVVYLDVDYAVASERISKPEKLKNRPLFVKNGVQYWQELLSVRHRIFMNNCDLRIRTGFKDGNFIDAKVVAKRILKASQLPIIRVQRQDAEQIDYNIVSGFGASSQVASKISNLDPTVIPKVAILYTKSVLDYANNIERTLSEQEVDSIKYEIADAEEGKSFAEYAKCLEFLARNKFTRTDFIVALGGGALTDAAGFIASSYLRGIGYINIPTSLLAMVDASVGGKTAINLNAGKNLCGAFYPPKAVYLDQEFLKTLRKRELIEGFGEIVKMGLTFDSELLNILDKLDFGAIENDDATAGFISDDLITELIYRSVNAKTQVVSKDLRDNGLREFLNYGHTLGHIIEKLENYQIRHGAAVSIGAIFASELAFELGLIPRSLVEKHYYYFKRCQLPVKWTPSANGVTVDKIIEEFGTDKKSQGSSLRFVLLSGEQTPQIVTNPPLDAVKRALNKVISIPNG